MQDKILKVEKQQARERDSSIQHLQQLLSCQAEKLSDLHATRVAEQQDLQTRLDTAKKYETALITKVCSYILIFSWSTNPIMLCCFHVSRVWHLGYLHNVHVQRCGHT